MKLEIKVHPGAKKEKLIEGERFEVWLREKPEGGKANLALVRILAKHFSIPKSSVAIVRGRASRKKFVKIHL